MTRYDYHFSMAETIYELETMKLKRDYKIVVSADMNNRTFWWMELKAKPVNPSEEDKQLVATMLQEIIDKIKN